MKHDLRSTLLLLLLFVLAQLIGLGVSMQYMHVDEQGIAYDDLPLGVQRPDMDGASAVVFIIVGVLLGTGLLLLLIKFNLLRMWKFWYALALGFALIIAFNAFMPALLALLLSAALVFLRVARQNIYAHHISELFLYGGIAALFVSMLSISSALVLLLLISLYDMYAVWKSKHMVTLANFQTKAGLFAGLHLKPKDGALLHTSAQVSKQPQRKKTRVAILGGGDIAFPLLFIATIVKELLAGGMSKSLAFAYALVPVATTTLALALLFFYAQEKKFYPAMPFLSLGCIAGLMLLYI